MTATTLKLSDLAGPDAAGWSDVAVFVRDDGSESEPFVVTADRDGIYIGIQYADSRSAKACGHPVRRLGRGRLVPARIEMEVEADLAAQVRILREALRVARRTMQNEWCNKPRIGMEIACEMVDDALAATAPKEAAK